MGKATLITPETAARLLSVSIDTLRTWRARGTGPRYQKLGRAVRYQISALEEFAGCTFDAPSSSTNATVS